MGLLSPLINGFYHSYADIEFTVNGLHFVGITEINYDDNLNRAKVMGTAKIPLGLTGGKYEANGDFEMLLEAAVLMELTLGIPLLGGWRQTPVTATISYVPSGITNPLPLIVDVIPAFFIGKKESKNKIGDEASTRRYSMHIPGQILWNGVPSVIETATLGAVG
jgi:hypothetical protein